MLFDWLVLGQIVPTNPASVVRGPKYIVKKGKTSVLTADEARTLLDSIETHYRPASPRIGGLRDRAMIALLTYTFSRVGAAVKMRVEDASIETKIGCHTFRATGITEYLRNGSKLEIAQQMANHESARTTGATIR